MIRPNCELHRKSRRWQAPAALVVVLLAHNLLFAQPDSHSSDKASPPAPAALKTEPLAKEGPVPTTNLMKIMREGGVLMWPLAASSVIGLAFVFERLIALRRARVIPKPFVKRFLQQMREGTLDRSRALELCQENGSPVAEIFSGAVRKWGRPAVEVEQGIIDAGDRATNGLRKYLRVFSALTVISPLLGLLGTVFGMIQAFNAVATTDALGRPELLARGISQALLNTAFGLSIAIPAQSFYFYLVSKVDQLIIAMDGLAQEVVNLISAEDLQARSEDSRPAKARRTSTKPEVAGKDEG
jgi:biopolymer transport protein ExbB